MVAESALPESPVATEETEKTGGTDLPARTARTDRTDPPTALQHLPFALIVPLDHPVLPVTLDPRDRLAWPVLPENRPMAEFAANPVQQALLESLANQARKDLLVRVALTVLLWRKPDLPESLAYQDPPDLLDHLALRDRQALLEYQVLKVNLEMMVSQANPVDRVHPAFPAREASGATREAVPTVHLQELLPVIECQLTMTVKWTTQRGNVSSTSG